MNKPLRALLNISTVTLGWVTICSIIVYIFSDSIDLNTFYLRLMVTMKDWILEYLFIIFSVVSATFVNSNSEDIDENIQENGLTWVGSGTTQALLESNRNSALQGHYSPVAPYTDNSR